MLYCLHLPPGGWVHSVSFSGDGGRVCWVGHDSSLTVADASREMAKSQLKTKYLPFTAVTWVSQNNLVAVVGTFFVKPLSPELTFSLPCSQVLTCSFACYYMLTYSCYTMSHNSLLFPTCRKCLFLHFLVHPTTSPPYPFVLKLINHLCNVLVFFSQGHGCCPMLYSVDDTGKLAFVTKLDAAQRKESGSLT